MNAVFVNQELKLTFIVKDSVTGLPIDITAEPVKVLLLSPGLAETSHDAVIEDGPAGTCSYTCPINELNDDGQWAAKPYIDDTQVPGTVLRFDVSSKWGR